MEKKKFQVKGGKEKETEQRNSSKSPSVLKYRTKMTGPAGEKGA